MLNPNQWDKIIKSIPQIRTGAQAILVALVLLVVLVLGLTKPIQQLPAILVVAVIPLAMVIPFLKPLPPVFQFVLLLLIVLTSFGFMGVAVVKTLAYDTIQSRNTLDYSFRYDDKYKDMQYSLEERFLTKYRHEIWRPSPRPGYSEYRDMVLAEWRSDNPNDVEKKIQSLAYFFY